MTKAAGWWQLVGRACVVVGLLATVLARSAAGPDVAQWTVLVYVEAAPGLEELGHSYWQHLEQAALSDDVLVAAEVVQWDNNESKPLRVRRRLYSRSGCRYELVEDSASSQAARLANLIKWGMERAPARRYALVVAGHGQLAPVRSAEGPVQNKPNPEAYRLALGELREALAQGLSGQEAAVIDVLFLDCCFGLTLEVGRQLSPMARVVVGSPGLLYSPGMPWNEILLWLGTHPGASARALAGHAIAGMRDYWQQESELALSVLAIDLSKIRAISQTLETWTIAASEHMPALASELTLARSQAENWGPYSELVDLGGFMTGLATITSCATVAQCSRQVVRAVEQSVVASHLGGGLKPGSIRHRGLAVFFALEVEDWPGSRLVSVQSRWSRFVEQYLDILRGLMVQQAGPELPG